MYLITTIQLTCVLFFSICYGSQVLADSTNHARTIVFATSFPENSFYYKKYYAVYREAFRRLGYEFNLSVYPSKRLAQSVNDGTVDGDVSRINLMHANNQYPNIIRVDEPITKMHISAFSQNKNLPIKYWKDFKNGAYTIGYPRGYRIVEIYLLPLIDSNRIIEVSDSEQGARMLVGNRFDVLVDVKRTIEFLLTKEEFHNNKVKHIAILETIILYPYLNKKFKHLVGSLGKTLNDMKKDGSYSRIINRI